MRSRRVSVGKRILRPVAGAVLATAVMLGLGACDPTPESSPAEPIVIAGGGTTGVYYQYGKHLAEVLSHDLDEQFIVAETAGSIDNLLRIGAGEAMLGFAQSDAAASAVEGSGTFERVVPLRAIARLYDEYVHVVVRRDSDIEDLTDLVGRKVSLGAKNSGVNLVAMRVLEAARVDAGAVSNAGLGPDASIEALRSGQIDAFFWVGGVPTPGLEKLSADTPIRLLPIEAETVEQLNREHSGAYRVSEFPLGSYGWETPTVTMTVPNYLVVAENAPTGLVRSVTEALFASRTELAQQVPAAALLDRRQAIFTDPIELHPGAADYYVDTKR